MADLQMQSRETSEKKNYDSGAGGCICDLIRQEHPWMAQKGKQQPLHAPPKEASLYIQKAVQSVRGGKQLYDMQQGWVDWLRVLA